MKLFMLDFPARYGSIDPKESHRIPQWPEKKKNGVRPDCEKNRSYPPYKDHVFPKK